MSDDERTRARTRNPEPTSGSEGDQPAGRDLAAMRQRAARLSATGNGIIERALSGNSEDFLDQGRQQGGQ